LRRLDIEQLPDVPDDTPEVKRRTHRQTSLASGESSPSAQAGFGFGADNGSALVQSRPFAARAPIMFSGATTK
jgi:hypothetical protein